MSLLASDLNNPEFANPINPDSRLHVEFYPLERERNVWVGETLQEKKEKVVVDYVRMMVPGDTLSIRETPAMPHHKQRFPQQWSRYVLTKTGGAGQQDGVPLSEWPLLGVAQIEELRAKKFFTVDNIAHASDNNIQSVGMIAGMAPHAFRTEAMRFLMSKNKGRPVSAPDERVKALEEENARLKAETEAQKVETDEKLAAMQAQIAAILSSQKPDDTLRLKK